MPDFPGYLKPAAMTPLRSHLADLLLTLLTAAGVGWVAGGLTGLFAALALVLAVWLWRHLLYLQKLRRWLASPKLRRIPEGRGIWQDVFDTLLAQAKSRKKRKQQLASALQRFNRAAETMPNGVMILDRDGRIEWMNRLAAEHLNLQEGDRGGILGNLIRVPEFHRFLYAPAEESRPLKLSLPDARQRPRTLALTRTPFENGADLLISQDISAAEQLNATRTAFVANVSHELRTPLTVINGFLETLADMPDLPREQQQAFIVLMRKEGERMLHLLADLLTLSRLESRTAAGVEYRPLDLSALCFQVAEAARALSQGQHAIEADIEPGLIMQGIQADLYSALSNLAFNAVRYTPAGGRIQIVLAAEGGTPPPQARFSIRDSGPGIAPEHLPRLTERFYRVDPGRSRQSGGTGLGLAITKHALAEHNTRLEIDSTVGVGSTFSVRLDLAGPDTEGSGSAEP